MKLTGIVAFLAVLSAQAAGVVIGSSQFSYQVPLCGP